MKNILSGGSWSLSSPTIKETGQSHQCCGEGELAALACWEVMVYPAALLGFPEPWVNIYIISFHWSTAWDCRKHRTNPSWQTFVVWMYCFSGHDSLIRRLIPVDCPVQRTRLLTWKQTEVFITTSPLMSYAALDNLMLSVPICKMGIKFVPVSSSSPLMENLQVGLTLTCIFALNPLKSSLIPLLFFISVLQLRR